VKEGACYSNGSDGQQRDIQVDGVGSEHTQHSDYGNDTKPKAKDEKGRLYRESRGLASRLFILSCCGILYASPNMIREVKSIRVIREGYVERVGR
jgi:hypothetical protein